MEAIRPVQEDVESEISEAEEELINSNHEPMNLEDMDLMPDKQKKMDEDDLMELEKLVQQEQKKLDVKQLQKVDLGYPSLMEAPVSIAIDHMGVMKKTIAAAAAAKAQPQVSGYGGINDSFVDERTGMGQHLKLDQDLEIREVYETRADADSGPVLKKYMVHVVEPATDTLFQIAYKYKVSKRELQYINKFSGEDIFFLKEMLIPYKGAQAQSGIKKKPDQEKTEALRRAGCLIMLNDQIMALEVQASHQGKIHPQKMGRTYRQEASYYLTYRDWDYKAALEEFKKDLQFEIDHRQQEKEMRKANKRKGIKNRNSIDFLAEQENGGNSCVPKGASNCSIF